MLELLNRPYPFTFQPWRRIKQLIPIALCVFMFFVLFKPFGDSIFVYAYMCSCATFAGLITTVLIPLTFPKYFNETKWTIKRNLLWVIWIQIIFVTLLFFAFNILFIYKFHNSEGLTLKNFLRWVYLQLIFGVPLGIIINMVNQYYLLKKHLKIASNINNTINVASEPTNTTILESEVDKFNKTKIAVEDLIYVEALGNYINIGYHCQENRKITVRDTISNLEHTIGESKLIYRPHRSYLVCLIRK